MIEATSIGVLSSKLTKLRIKKCNILQNITPPVPIYVEQLEY